VVSIIFFIGETFRQCLRARLDASASRSHWITDLWMRTGNTNSEEYLEDWRSSESLPIEGEDAQAFLVKLAADIEADYPRERVLALIKSGGRE